MIKNNILEIGPDCHLTAEDIYFISHDHNIKIQLSNESIRKIKENRGVVDEMVANKKIIYGVTTGFGNFKNKFIEEIDVKNLQKNLIRSHAVSVGDCFDKEVVRAIMVVRANSLSQGFSGIRLVLLETLLQIINNNIIPVVPSQGSVGSSGDLAPLSHIGLVLMGEGYVFVDGQKRPSLEVLKENGIEPIEFHAKEGLAFNNGTAAMSGVAALSICEGKLMLDIADAACALTLESICGVPDAYDEKIHKVRPHAGQQLAAQRIREFINGSKLINSVENRVQDSYSLRCSPQVHGAIRDALKYVERTIDTEINSVTDNPIVFTENNQILSGGNFHGEPVAIAMDTFGIAMSELANISERRTAKLLDTSTNEGLPMFLIKADKGGLHNGLMIPQYTSASLVSENKVLAHPASVDSIPTSANQEDHVSMGTTAARKGNQILQNLKYVLAIEFLTNTQALDFRNKDDMAPRTKEIYNVIRSVCPKIEDDRFFGEDIERIKNILLKEDLLKLI